MNFLYGILLVGGLAALYVLFYLLNEKTKVPEGCELPEDFHGCGACSSASCMSRKKPEKRP